MSRIRSALARIYRAMRRLISPILRFFEKRYLTPLTDSAPAPVFIIGAPRTGSTVLYQALTNIYDVAYIDNVACGWHNNLRFGMWLSERLYGSKAHDNFKANHGDTAAFGGHAPSECGGFWYRWLPTDRHFVDYKDITPAMVWQLREEVLGVSSRVGKPLVFKNLNAGQRLRLIKKAFPDAKLIFVRRDPRFVTRSILKARARLGIAEGVWWSIRPQNFESLKSLPEPEMCAAQIYYLEKQIEKDLSLFPKESFRVIHYQELEIGLIHRLGDWIGASARTNADCPAFKKDRMEELSCDELRKLNELVALYPFEKELFV